MNLSFLLSKVLDCDVIESSFEDGVIYYNQSIQYWDETSKYFTHRNIEKGIHSEIFMKLCKLWFFDKLEQSIFSGMRTSNGITVFEANVLNSYKKNIDYDNEENAVFKLCLELLGENNE